MSAPLRQVGLHSQARFVGMLANDVCDLSKVWLGYQQSLQPVHMGLSLDVDLATTAFLEEQLVINFLRQ